MNRTAAIIIAILLVGGVAWWLINSGKDESTTTQNQAQQSATETTPHAATGEVLSGEVTIQIQDFAFAPSSIKVKKGARVTWTNQDSVEHNVVSDSDSQGKGLNGPLLGKGESYSFTFDTLGTYTYHCTPHPNMQATVEVVE